jgi:hypothetical protein
MMAGIQEEQPRTNEEFIREATGIIATCAESGLRLEGISSVQHFVRRPRCYKCNLSKEKLFECKFCHGVATCGNKECREAFGMEHTPMDCERHAIIIAAFVLQWMQEGVPLKVATSKRYSKKFPANWVNYFRKCLSDLPLPRQMLDHPPIAAILTNSTTAILTAIYCLKKYVPGSDEMSEITVHYLGCTGSDCIGVAEIYEEFFHWFPALRTLSIAHVGPDARPVKKSTFDYSYCEGCTKLGCKVHYVSEKALYHESTVAEKEGATLVFAQNSGLHEHITNVLSLNEEAHENYADLWRPTLQLIAERCIPSVFTSYNKQEAMQDSEILQEIAAGVVESGGTPLVVYDSLENPYRSLLPRVEPIHAAGLPETFFYDSYWLNFMGKLPSIPGSK